MRFKEPTVTSTATSKFLTEFLRHPRHVVLLMVIPVVIVEGFGIAMSSFPDIPGMQTPPADSGRMFGAIFSTAFLTGIFGLNQAMSSKSSDRRLILCGLSARRLLLIRIVTVLAVSGAIAVYSFGIMLVTVSPQSVFQSFVFLFVGGLVYALVGVAIGAFSTDVFEGSLLILFIADLDAFLGSGMAQISETNVMLPLYFPNKLFRASVAGTAIERSSLLFMSLYVAGLLGLTYAVYTRSMGRSVA